MNKKYKTIDGTILTYTPHTAWVQIFGKQPRLLRNSGAALVPNLVLYGPCRPSRLSDYIAYKSARRTGPCLRFLDIKKPQAPQNPMFKEDSTTGLPTKVTMQEKSAQSQGTSKVSPTKRKAIGKRTGKKPVRKLQTPTGLSLQTEIEQINNNAEKEDDSSKLFDLHQSDKIRKRHHLQPQQESRLETDRRH